MFLQWGLKPCLLLVPWCTSASEPYQLHFHKTTYLDDHGVAISQHSPTFFEGSIPPRSCMTFDGFGINIVWSWWAMDLPHSLYIPLYLLPWSYHEVTLPHTSFTFLPSFLTRSCQTATCCGGLRQAVRPGLASGSSLSTLPCGVVGLCRCAPRIV